MFGWTRQQTARTGPKGRHLADGPDLCLPGFLRVIEFHNILAGNCLKQRSAASDGKASRYFPGLQEEKCSICVRFLRIFLDLLRLPRRLQKSSATDCSVSLLLILLSSVPMLPRSLIPQHFDSNV